MLLKTLRLIGLWPTLIIITLTATLISILLTGPVASLVGIQIDFSSLLISTVIPLIIAPIFGYMQLRMLTELEAARLELLELAATDSLTGITNRRHFFELAENALAQTPPGSPISLAVIDADNFKQVNDSFGHLVGDETLLQIVSVIRAAIRPDDIFARFGGDEFILLFPNSDQEDIFPLIRQLLYQIQQIQVENEHHSLFLSITIGVATSTGRQQSLRSLIARADQALLEAKQLGGHRIQISNTSP